MYTLVKLLTGTCIIIHVAAAPRVYPHIRAMATRSLSLVTVGEEEGDAWLEEELARQLAEVSLEDCEEEEEEGKESEEVRAGGDM